MNSVSSEDMALQRSPIASLPTEMLSTILEAAPIPPDERLEFAISVSQVSRLWRLTAIHTTFLWSSILLLARCGTGWHELIKLMIKFSRSHPLDITLEVYREGDDAGFEHNLQSQLGVVIPEVSRWRSFSYGAFFHDDALLFFDPLSRLSAPLLEVIDVEVALDDEDEFTTGDFCLFSGGAPLLSQIRVVGMNISSCLPPTLSLTSLKLFNSPEPIKFQLFREILTTSRTLTHIELDGDVVCEDRLWEFAMVGQFIDLPALRSLWLAAEIFPKHQLFCLLSILRCPGIETLRIAATKPANNSPDSRARHTYELPKYASLRSLELRHVDCTWLGEDFDATKLLNLAQVTFSWCSKVMVLFKALIPDVEDGSNIWPLLQVIRFDVGSLDDDDVEGFCEVLSYRTRCGKPIECLKFDTMIVDLIADGKYVAPLRELVRVETCW
jgi:hypothetical protein